MKKPKLEDYGLTGIDSRPRADYDNFPITPEERSAAIKKMIEYTVETARVVAFRNDLNKFEWENGIR